MADGGKSEPSSKLKRRGEKGNASGEKRYPVRGDGWPMRNCGEASRMEAPLSRPSGEPIALCGVMGSVLLVA